MAGKLPETANIIGGTVQGANLIDNAQIMVEEDTARLPSYYRALAVTASDDYTESKRIPRATVSGPGAAVAGRLKTRAPVDTAEPVVQKYEASDGSWRRKSTSETTWSGWIPTDPDDNGALALSGALSSTNVTPSNFLRIGTSSEALTIASGAVTPSKTFISINGEGAAADDLVTINATNMTGGELLVMLGNTSHNITVKKKVGGTGNILCDADFVLSSNQDVALFTYLPTLGMLRIAPFADNA